MLLSMVWFLGPVQVFIVVLLPAFNNLMAIFQVHSHFFCFLSFCSILQITTVYFEKSNKLYIRIEYNPSLGVGDTQVTSEFKR